MGHSGRARRSGRFAGVHHNQLSPAEYWVDVERDLHELQLENKLRACYAAFDSETSDRDGELRVT